jgi:DNA (cytosine-5)-methyltransferase 1
MKVLGAFVFMGSATIGVMQNGVKPDRILELVDGMSEDNAKHFVHNYPEIPVVEPSVWENDEYLEELRKEGYDLLYGNPPCSGLSLGVRGPQSHEKGPNCHQYRYMDIIKKVQPKAFMYENAPTLISTGKPILNDFIKQLPEYNFTVIRDFGMYHNVAMKRQRTFFIGWRKDVFEKIPTLHMKQQPRITVQDVIGDLQNVELGTFLNHVLIHDRAFQDVEFVFPDVPYVKGGEHTVNWVIVNEYEKYEPLLNEKTKKALKTQLYKQRAGLGYWDKSSQRPDPKALAPSLTGYSSFIHPVLHRQFTIREYARLMGYPDTFEILDTKPGREVVRHIAQGVPANFFGYASGEVLAALKGERDSIQQFGDTRVTFQHHNKKTLDEFTTEEFLNNDKIHEVKDKTKKQELTV